MTVLENKFAFWFFYMSHCNVGITKYLLWLKEPFYKLKLFANYHFLINFDNDNDYNKQDD